MSSEEKEDFFDLIAGGERYGIVDWEGLLHLIEAHLDGDDFEEPVEIVVNKLTMTRKEFEELPEL